MKKPDFNSEREEEHPWKRFPIENNNSKSLILGSFPPSKFTIDEYPKTICDIDFFYGSKENSFWDLFIDAKNLDIKWPDEIQKLKDWLYENKWVVSDIVLKTKRKNDTAFDNDLNVVEWNENIIEGILLNNPIKKIYFTSRFVEEKFKKKIERKLKLNLDKIEFVTLISPSPNGLRKAEWSYKLTSSPKLKNETLTEFRLRYYTEKLKN